MSGLPSIIERKEEFTSQQMLGVVKRKEIKEDVESP